MFELGCVIFGQIRMKILKITFQRQFFIKLEQGLFVILLFYINGLPNKSTNIHTHTRVLRLTVERIPFFLFHNLTNQKKITKDV